MQGCLVIPGWPIPTIKQADINNSSNTKDSFLGSPVYLRLVITLLVGSHTTESQHIFKIIESSIRTVRFDYNGETYRYSPLIIYIICFLVGIIGGIYGIGGGLIVAPFVVAIVGLPVYTVAGAALMGTFITSVAGVAFYQYLSMVHANMSVAPDWMLGALFGFGGFFGMYLGARTQKYVSATIIKSILCCCILFVAVRYIVGYFWSTYLLISRTLECKTPDFTWTLDELLSATLTSSVSPFYLNLNPITFDCPLRNYMMCLQYF